MHGLKQHVFKGFKGTYTVRDSGGSKFCTRSESKMHASHDLSKSAKRRYNKLNRANFQQLKTHLGEKF